MKSHSTSIDSQDSDSRFSTSSKNDFDNENFCVK